MDQEPIAVTLLVITALESLGIRYLLSGSLASAIYGEPRATRDADILADIKSEHIQTLCQMLERDFSILADSIHTALVHRTSFSLIHRLGNEISDQQWRDVVGMIKANESRFDFEYLRRTAHQLGVLDLFEKAMSRN